jgi:hypothetical protein
MNITVVEMVSLKLTLIILLLVMMFGIDAIDAIDDDDDDDDDDDNDKNKDGLLAAMHWCHYSPDLGEAPFELLQVCRQLLIVCFQLHIIGVNAIFRFAQCQNLRSQALRFVPQVLLSVLPWLSCPSRRRELGRVHAERGDRIPLWEWRDRVMLSKSRQRSEVQGGKGVCRVKGMGKRQGKGAKGIAARGRANGKRQGPRAIGIEASGKQRVRGMAMAYVKLEWAQRVIGTETRAKEKNKECIFLFK